MSYFFLKHKYITYLTAMLIISLVPLGKGFRCYICGTDSPSIPNCDNFNSTNEHEYIKSCPPGSVGCSSSTLIHGGTYARDCENYAITDCKTANGVIYCHCQFELCNREILSASTIGPTDDEDLDSGSGLSDDINEMTKPPAVINEHKNYSSSCSDISLTVIMVLTISVFHNHLNYFIQM